MANITFSYTWYTDVGLSVQNIPYETFNGEENAHTFQIHGINPDSEDVEITGTITAKFLRSDSVTVPLTGTIEDGIAIITLSAECYTCPGRFILSIYDTINNSTTCIFCGVGYVRRTSSEEVVYPTLSLPDLTQLLIDVQSAIASIPADYTAVLEAIAETFDASTDYNVNEIVWYNGTLYKFTQTHTAGIWDPEDVETVSMGTSLSKWMNSLQADVTRFNNLRLDVDESGYVVQTVEEEET